MKEGMNYETFKLLAVLVAIVVIAASIGPLTGVLLARIGWLKHAESIGDRLFRLGQWSGQTIIKHRWIALAVACIGGSVLLASQGI